MRRPSSLLLPAVLAVALSILPGLGSVGVRAADTPDGAVDALLDTIVSGEWDRIGPLVCEEKREEVLAEYDLVATFGGDGLDPQPLIDSLAFAIEGRRVTLLSETGDTGSVNVAGTLMASVDTEAARAWMVELLETFEQPTDEATVDQFLGEMLADLAQGSTLDATVDVVRVDGEWLVCDDLRSDAPEESFDPDATIAPVEGALCDLMSIEELNAATGLAFTDTVPFEGGCSWDADIMSDDYFNVSAYLEEGDLDVVRSVWTQGTEVTIAGFPAWATVNGTWVDLGDGLLTIMPWLTGESATGTIDPVALAAAVAAIVVPRLP